MAGRRLPVVRRSRRRRAPQSARVVRFDRHSLLAKIYMNLRATVTLQEETGVEIDYLLPGRYFPAPLEPLLRTAA
jgi:hypothetical protein